jgi:hypothetical protein
MIQGFSKAVNQFLAPLLSLTSLLLIMFAYFSPVLMLQTQVALLTVTPSVSLTQPTEEASSVDGPSVFLGPLGEFHSCLYALYSLTSIISKAHAKGQITKLQLPVLRLPSPHITVRFICVFIIVSN